MDKSFIGGSPHDGELSAIARAIIGLGRNLRMEVVAEGIERAEQLAFVAGEGCHYAQGYWFSRPRSATEMDRLLEVADFSGVGRAAQVPGDRP